MTAFNAAIVALWVATRTVSVFPRKESLGAGVSWMDLSIVASVILSAFQLVMWFESRTAAEPVDFPADVILVAVAVASTLGMNATRKTSDRAFEASSNLARKISKSKHS